MRILAIVLLLLTQFSALASRDLVRVSSVDDFEHIDSMTSNKMKYFSNLYPARDLHSSKISFLEDENLTPSETRLSVLMARAQFRLYYKKDSLGPGVFNLEGNLRKIYDSKINSKASENVYNMTKTKVVVDINYKLGVYKTLSGDIADQRIQKIVDESRALDDSEAKYLGSVIHVQKDFSKIFEGGTLIANIYKVNESEVIASAYNVSYVRNSAINTLDNILIWSSARKELNKEVEKTLKVIFQIAKNISN